MTSIDVDGCVGMMSKCIGHPGSELALSASTMTGHRQWESRSAPTDSMDANVDCSGRFLVGLATVNLINGCCNDGTVDTLQIISLRTSTCHAGGDNSKQRCIGFTIFTFI